MASARKKPKKQRWETELDRYNADLLKKNYDGRLKTLEDGMQNIATKEDLGELIHLLMEVDPMDPDRMRPKFATKKDVEPVIELYNNLVTSARITTNLGKYGKTAILTMAAIIIALGVITGGLKTVAAAFFAWVMR